MDAERMAQDRLIDPSQLDLAAATQADTFFHWGEQATVARADMDQAKIQIELAENRLALECRKEPEKFNLTKVTEAGITAAVKNHVTYQEAVDRYLEAKQESQLADVAVVAMEQRKRMIECLITLHGQQYFAGPSVPRDLFTAWHDRQEAQAVDLNKRQRARCRKTKGRVVVQEGE